MMTMRPSPLTQVEHLLAGLESAELEHLLDDGLGRRIVGRELFRVAGLRVDRQAPEKE